ncbi:MAG: MerR family transcriptional regulator [Chloroflexota bacterium]
MGERPLYTISVVADLVGVRQSTLREWEKQELVTPPRRNGLRLYTDNDLRRLRFIGSLVERGLNLAGVRYLISLYPCWHLDACPKCIRKTERSDCSRECWKEEGTFCMTSLDDVSVCDSCEYYPEHRAGACATGTEANASDGA